MAAPGKGKGVDSGVIKAALKYTVQKDEGVSAEA
jgi:hypothetical protein